MLASKQGHTLLTAALPSYPVGRVLDNRFTDENQREPLAVVGSHRPTLGLAVARIHDFPPGDAGAVRIGQPLAAARGAAANQARTASRSDSNSATRDGLLDVVDGRGDGRPLPRLGVAAACPEMRRHRLDETDRLGAMAGNDRRRKRRISAEWLSAMNAAPLFRSAAPRRLHGGQRLRLRLGLWRRYRCGVCPQLCLDRIRDARLVRLAIVVHVIAAIIGRGRVRRAPATRLSPERERERRRRHGTQQHLDCKSPHGPRKGTCDRVHEHTTWPIMSTRSRIRDSGVARGSVGTPAPSPLRRASQTRSISASRFSAVSIICPRRRKTSGSKTALCVRR